MTQSKAYLILLSMMLVTLLSTAGIALPYPILAPLFTAQGADSVMQFANWEPKLLLAVALAVYPLGLLLGSSFIGALSDSYGRKPTLVITLLLSVGGYILTGWAIAADSYLLFLLARFVTGVFEGNLAITRAVAADLHPVVDKTKAFSWLYAANYAGWLIGPLLGGYLMEYGAYTAFYFAAGALFCSALFVQVLLPAEQASHQHSGILKAVMSNNSFGLLQHQALRRVFTFYLLLALGLNAFYEFYPLWLVEILDYDSKGIGHMTVLVTAMMIIVSATAASWLRHRIGKIRTVLSGLTGLTLLLLLTPWVDAYSAAWYFAAAGAMIGLYNGVLAVYISDRYEHMGQGKLLGMLYATFCLANVLIALVGGLLSLYGATWSIVFGGVLMLTGTGLLWRFDQQVPVPQNAHPA